MSDEWKEEPEMKLERVNYADLSSKQKRVFNFQKIAGALADYGFNCIKRPLTGRAPTFWLTTRTANKR